MVRTRLSVDERRRRLLELGRELFGEQAYDELSIDDIAVEQDDSVELSSLGARDERQQHCDCQGQGAEEKTVKGHAGNPFHDGSVP